MMMMAASDLYGLQPANEGGNKHTKSNIEALAVVANEANVAKILYRAVNNFFTKSCTS